jgi:CDP-diacylglycerol--glycerol-3-phosphate 3-phosphatidyltransferase
MHFDGQRHLYPHDRLLGPLLHAITPEWLIPNHFTIFRIVAAPFVFWLFWNNNYSLGLIAFCVAAFTDTWDGTLARFRNQITAWGVFFDPLADKLLIGGSGLILGFQFFHPAVVVMALVGDMLPLIRGVIVSRYRGVVLTANWWGKWKMILQCVSFITLLAGLVWGVPELTWVAEGTLVVASGLAVAAIVSNSL